MEYVWIIFTRYEGGEMVRKIFAHEEDAERMLASLNLEQKYIEHFIKKYEVFGVWEYDN